MFKRLIFLLLIFLLIAYQYGILIFLISSTFFASIWAITLVVTLLFIFIFSDKLILFSLKPVPFASRKMASHLDNVARLIGLKSIKIFHVKGRCIYTFRGILGGRYICVGRDLISSQEKNSSEDIRELINLSIISSDKRYQLVDQTLYCLVKLLFLPATTLESFFKLNFISSFLVWIYYPVKSLVIGTISLEEERINEKIYNVLRLSSKELGFLRLKYNLSLEDSVDILISSKSIIRPEQFHEEQVVSLA